MTPNEISEEELAQEKRWTMMGLTRKEVWDMKQENRSLKEKLRAALPIVAYVSAGRGYVDVEPYPDATARRVNAEIQDALTSQSERVDSGNKQVSEEQ